MVRKEKGGGRRRKKEEEKKEEEEEKSVDCHARCLVLGRKSKEK
jgi:hypothetical protein